MLVQMFPSLKSQVLLSLVLDIDRAAKVEIQVFIVLRDPYTEALGPVLPLFYLEAMRMCLFTIYGNSWGDSKL